MPSPKKGQKKTTKLPNEIEEFLEKYRLWYDRYKAINEGSNPDDPPPDPPGNDGDGD